MGEKKFVFLAIFAIISACSTVTVTRMNDFQIKKDIVYKTTSMGELRGDMYIPSIPGAKPAVLVVHGGGWDSRAGEMHAICDDLVGSGFVVYNITYRLAPAALYPASVEDVRDAVHFLKQHASEYQIDPEQISGWGYSAGAHLILMVGLDPKEGFKSIVAGGTPADFSMWPHSPIIYKYIGKTYQDAKSVWEEASPINHISPNSPPVFLYHGANDHLVEHEQMERMSAALQKQGVEVQTHTVPILGHIFTYLLSTKSIKLGIEFIQAHTRT